MIQLPPALVAAYRTAATHEIYSWSFGKLSRPSRVAADNWKQQYDTLDDQRIFGPLRLNECACGKWRGDVYQRMICDVCGVKLTTPEERRRRFGHINFASPIRHPLGQGDELLSALPVLPAAFINSDAGGGLRPLYDRLVTLVAAEESLHVADCVEQLFALLAPTVVFAHAWDLQDASTLARGLALTPIAGSSADYCCECGYPLTGLNTVVCPACGRRRLGN
jgi:hypothetical protein